MRSEMEREVFAGLKARQGEWHRMADDLQGQVSFGLISAIGYGIYESSLTMRKLEPLLGWLRTHPVKAHPLRRASDVKLKRAKAKARKTKRQRRAA